ncbi:hypothetical protein CYLTODRAFT_342156 [Cylindrobasidium torrendii FP15055 ss-10]|uniref:Sugar phosphate transporter domain-containing protein n=1 Tax=Cylindrobasidium torrendii FP15055 ss-10 TaxID=1314674 RepID=A0A0D7BV16_9AGAR|nr:hypothetical protein CYLTODRAFT_342156 [Cylindrobasidium torrendii FP15055 ss-10]
MIPLTAENVKIAAVVSFYMAAALVMVFVNKAVLNGSPDLPLFFLLLQIVIAVILLHVSAAISPNVKLPKIEVAVAKKLAPVVCVGIVGLVFNTLCLRGVEASFFQIARGLQLPLTIAVSSIQTFSVPSKRVLLAAGVVAIGFFVGVAPTSAYSMLDKPSAVALFYGFISSLMIAIHAVLVKSSLPHCNNSTIELAWWTNAGSTVLIIPFVVLSGEHVKLQELINTPGWNANLFIWGSLVTGVFGFLLCIAGLLSVKVTSPITHMFSSAARSVLQTILGVWIFGDLLTVNRGVSILVILIGTMYYTWVKSQEMPPPKAPQPPRDEEEGYALFDANEMGSGEKDNKA